MKRFFVSALLVLAWAPLAAAAKPMTVHLTSDPAGATVTVHKGYYSRETDPSCVTPCKLKIRQTRSDSGHYSVVFRKNGFEPATRMAEEATPGPEGPIFHVSLTSEADAIEKQAARQIAIDEIALEKCRLKAADIGLANGEPKPCRIVTPNYPATVNTDGYCDMQFDITPDGHTENIITTGCSDQRLGRASHAALSKWLYLPKRIDGKAVPEAGMTVRMTFRYVQEDGS
tara:strand:- start:82 stop:768 length:687 start_codon:yes stop_codon:yes gene_type:complete